VPVHRSEFLRSLFPPDGITGQMIFVDGGFSAT